MGRDLASLPNVRPILSRRHAESVLFVVQQLAELQLANMAHDYEIASREVERRGFADDAIRCIGGTWDPSDGDSTSRIFVLTLPGYRALRKTKPTEQDDAGRDEGIKNGCDPG